MTRRAKIVATLGPASDSPEKLRALASAGLDVARLNMSHGERARHAAAIAALRQAAGDVGRPIAVLLDLSGPKIRTGKLAGGSVVLRDGDEVRITGEEIVGDERCFSASYGALAREVHAGDRILLSDGELELEAVGATQSDVIARVVHGGTLGEHKGVNLPGARLSLPSLTEKDLEDLRFGIEHGVDFVALSFVRSAADCRAVRERIRELGGHARLVAKIEKPEAVSDLAGILEASDGVMIARGDLAVETSPELVPVLQKEIISKALAATRIAITATQMLQSMIENPRPTRAEASDVANATLDGSDALMLSGETAVGRFPVEAVAMMDRIIRSAEPLRAAGLGASPLLQRRAPGRQSGSYGRAIAEAALFAADEIGSRLIVVFTESGHLARFIAGLRPRQRIIALTHRLETCCQLPLLWGVEPYLLEDSSPVSERLLAASDRTLLRHRLAEPGEHVVVMIGSLTGVAISNSMKLHRVGELAADDRA
jgi:pyruvate kinase